MPMWYEDACAAGSSHPMRVPPKVLAHAPSLTPRRVSCYHAAASEVSHSPTMTLDAVDMMLIETQEALHYGARRHSIDEPHLPMRYFACGAIEETSAPLDRPSPIAPAYAHVGCSANTSAKHYDDLLRLLDDSPRSAVVVPKNESHATLTRLSQGTEDSAGASGGAMKDNAK